MKTIFFILVFIAIVAYSAQSAEILVINPTPSYSHALIPFVLAKELANRGHHVTVVSAYPQKTKISNYIDVPVVENIAAIEEWKKQNELFNRAAKGIIENLTSVFDMIAKVVNITIHHENVKDLLKSNKKFDVVIFEHFFNEAFVGFGEHFKAPIILVSTVAACGMNSYIFANPLPPSYVPSFGGKTSKYMNFWERIQNLFMGAVFNSLVHLYQLPQQRRLFKSYITGVELDDVLYNTSLMLTNSHVSFSDAIPHVPSVVEVGGFHVTPKPLPEDLKKFLDEAKEGVILFSMGSNLRSKDLKLETRDAILKAFSKIKQKVLWKFEIELPNAPENVKIMSWLPQQDVLGHPNVQAFITHGGRFSTIEAIYFGVPIIGIPVFGDQPGNVAAAVRDGYAVRVNLDELSEEKLTEALNEILTNPKYKEEIQRRFKLIHDQPLKPIDTAIFWIEHVIRQKGATHLRSAGLDLKWYQRELIDVIAFLFAVLSVLITATYLAIKKLWNFIFFKKVVTATTKRKNAKLD